jgi:hypothetical protein
MNNITDIKYNIFSKNTYKRLFAIQNIHIDNNKYMNNITNIINYLETLPPCNHPNNKYSIRNNITSPLNALRESRFARFNSVVDSVNTLTREYTIYLPPHQVIIYGNNVSQKYINHVANIIRWWSHIKPQKYIVTLYLTNLKKRLPPTNQPKVLTEEYANSGFTFIAKPCEIHIFRKEESLKVLIHELIHASKFDFDNNHLLHIPLNVKDDNITNEGITEYLAINFYYWYVAQYIYNFHTKFNIEPHDIYRQLILHDIQWQEYQNFKILSYFNMQPIELLEKNNFRQYTSILSYFFLKNYLFTQNSISIILSRNLTNINNLIKKMREYITNMKIQEVLPNSISMRMSLFELNY